MTNTERPASAPTPAPVDSGAIGRLNDALAAHRHPGEVLHIFGEAWMVCSCGQRIDIPVVDGKISYAVAAQLFEAHQVVALAAIVREHTDRALAEAWDAALRHVWALNDPAYTVITDTESIHPILTRRDVEQATNENPYRAARQERGRG